MHETQVLRFVQRATQAETLVSSLKEELKSLINSAKMSLYAAEENRLRNENQQLMQQVEAWKAKLVAAEVKNGIRQVALPNAKQVPSTPVAVPVANTSAITEDKPPTTKPEKPKQAKAAKKTDTEGKQAAKPGKKAADSDEGKPVDVSRLDMRVGRIISASKHPDADSLYVEQVDVGEEKPRTVVSGLVKFVPIEEMQNRLAVLMCNLKPAKMRGVLSEAMVMCASTPEKVEILIPPPNCVPGDRVTVKGFPGECDEQLNPKKKIFEQVAPDLKTDDNCNATYKGTPWEIEGKGVVTSSTLKNVQIK